MHSSLFRFPLNKVETWSVGGVHNKGLGKRLLLIKIPKGCLQMHYVCMAFSYSIRATFWPRHAAGLFMFCAQQAPFMRSPRTAALRIPRKRYTANKATETCVCSRESVLIPL
jgi:hypothetical protein